ncbi:MAG: hypothetical protein IJF20_07655 [Clostridia bacterium]|nr:hypothetical protein [Clostridia bacterium]
MLKNILKHLLRIVVGILIFVILTTVCVQLFYYREKENDSVKNLSFISEDDPLFLKAHRGVTAFAPENSLPAFEKADDMDYYAAECDVILTKDNKWVITHDDTMFLHFWSFKKVSESNYSELKKIGYKNGVNFTKHDNMYLPTLDEYLDILKDSDTKAQIEIKTETTDRLEEILHKLEERNMKENSMIISFNIEQLRFLRNFDKEIELWYLTEEINENVISDFQDIGGNATLAIKGSEISDENIKNTIAKGITLAAWTINDTEQLERLYNLGIRYITTDKFCN